MTMGDRICVMKDGHIMQVADPVTLYNRPANAFVAGFIGSPEMNLIAAELSGNGELVTAGQTISIADGLAQRLRHDAPRQVTVGIRPQHLKIEPPETAGTLSGRISHVEFMGHEVYLYVQIGDERVIAVIPSSQYDRSAIRDDRVWLSPDIRSTHIFNRMTGENISLAD
jgi:oligogalacturonide transport system ATP-binding protein